MILPRSSLRSTQHLGRSVSIRDANFLKSTAEQAVAILRIIGSEDVTPAVNETNNTISEIERATSEGLRKRRPNLNFSEMGITPGCVLNAIEGEETATVVSDRKVSFRDQTMSLTTRQEYAVTSLTLSTRALIGCIVVVACQIYMRKPISWTISKQ